MKNQFVVSALLLFSIIFVAGCVSQLPAGTKEQAKRDDFGCFYSCDYFPAGYAKQMCEDWKAGKNISWPADCSLMVSNQCVKLCEVEARNKTTAAVQPNYSNFTPPGSSPEGFEGYPQFPGGFTKPTGIPDSDPESENVYIYIADFRNDRIIRMEDMTGKGWVSFGTKGNGVGQFFEPTEIAVDKMGRIYISDGGNNRIARIDDMTGKGWVSYPFRYTFGIDLDSKGRIYVTEGTRIVRIDNMNGDGLATFGAPGSGVGQFNGLKYMEIDSQDRIYVGDKCNYRVVRMDDMAGNGWTVLQSSGTGFADPTCGGVKTLGGSGVGQFNREIGGLAIDSRGRIYIADEHNDRIVRVDDMDGSGWVEFKGITGNSLSLPHDISMSKSGKIYIADTMNNRIVRVDGMNGTGWISFAPYTIFYSKGAHQWQMEAPKGILVVER